MLLKIIKELFYWSFWNAKLLKNSLMSKFNMKGVVRCKGRHLGHGMYIQHNIYQRASLFFNTLNGDAQYITFLFLVGIQAKENDSLSQLV